LRSPRGAQGHEQSGVRYAVVVQSDLLPLSTWLVAPTSTSARGATFRPEVSIDVARPGCWPSKPVLWIRSAWGIRPGTSASMNCARSTPRCAWSWVYDAPRTCPARGPPSSTSPPPAVTSGDSPSVAPRRSGPCAGKGRSCRARFRRRAQDPVRDRQSRGCPNTALREIGDHRPRHSRRRLTSARRAESQLPEGKLRRPAAGSARGLAPSDGPMSLR